MGGGHATLRGGLTLIRCGGHFDGGSVLHWPAGQAGGAPDRRHHSSCAGPPPRRLHVQLPELHSTPRPHVRRVAAAVEPFEFDRIYGAWWDRVSTTGAHEIVRRSADRYIAALEGRYPA